MTTERIKLQSSMVRTDFYTESNLDWAICRNRLEELFHDLEEVTKITVVLSSTPCKDSYPVQLTGYYGEVDITLSNGTHEEQALTGFAATALRRFNAARGADKNAQVHVSIED